MNKERKKVNTLSVMTFELVDKLQKIHFDNLNAYGLQVVESLSKRDSLKVYPNMTQALTTIKKKNKKKQTNKQKKKPCTIVPVSK